MGIQGLGNIKTAISSLNPDHVRQLAAPEAHVALVAGNPAAFLRLEQFLLGDLSPDRAADSSRLLTRESNPPLGTYDFVIYDEEAAAPRGSYVFKSADPDRLIEQVLDGAGDLGISLARAFPPFRRPFIERVISKTCHENTLFALATALPDVIPSILQLPWALAEFASDTAFITMNQLRMAFLIAAASNRTVGYREQRSEIATVIAGAFGWRALARELVGKIPFGGGLIAKAAVAYAGTRVVGLSLERLYAIGYHYTREERDNLYSDALQKGKAAAVRLLSHIRPDLAARFGPQESASGASAGGAA